MAERPWHISGKPGYLQETRKDGILSMAHGEAGTIGSTPPLVTQRQREIDTICTVVAAEKIVESAMARQNQALMRGLLAVALALLLLAAGLSLLWSAWIAVVALAVVIVLTISELRSLRS